jgi:hypothetical protein
MRILHRKVLIALVVLALLFTSRIYDIANWLEKYNLVHSARDVEKTYLTGTAIAVLVALFILLRDNGNHPAS